MPDGQLSGVLGTACTTRAADASLDLPTYSVSRMARMAFLRTERSRRSR
jgi:hypothetical protein